MCFSLRSLGLGTKQKNERRGASGGFVLAGPLIESSQGKRGNSSAWQIYKKT